MKQIKAILWYLWKTRPRIKFKERHKKKWLWRIAKAKFGINKDWNTYINKRLHK